MEKNTKTIPNSINTKTNWVYLKVDDKKLFIKKDCKFCINIDFYEKKNSLLKKCSENFSFCSKMYEYNLNIEKTFEKIKEKNYIFHFYFKRIFVDKHKQRIISVYDELHNKSKDKGYLKQYIESKDGNNNNFFVELRMLKPNHKNQYNKKVRIFFLFNYEEQTLYPLFVDTKHQICKKEDEQDEKNK